MVGEADGDDTNSPKITLSKSFTTIGPFSQSIGGASPICPSGYATTAPAITP